MYFKKLAEKLTDVPDYVIEYMTDYIPEMQEKAVPSLRKIFGDQSKILSFKNSSVELQNHLEFVQHFVMSQQYDFLKNLIPYERSCMLPGKDSDITTIPNRYINRIGESIIIPISGKCSIQCDEFSHVAQEINVGEVWRYNTRVPMNFKYSDNFVCIIITYIDFDMSHYLMPFDVHGIFPRRRDEWIDSTLEDFKNKEIDTNAY